MNIYTFSEWNMWMFLIVLVSFILLGFHLGNELEKERCSRVDFDEMKQTDPSLLFFSLSFLLISVENS